MSRPEQHSEVETRLAELGERVGAVRSVAGEVRSRIDAVAIESSWIRRWLIASTIVIVALAGAARWAYRSPPARPSSHHDVIAVAESSPPFLQIGEVTIRLRFAGAVDSRSTLVCWSCTGATPLAALSSKVSRPIRRGGYTEISIRMDAAPSGEVFCWSLFIAEPGGTEPGELPKVCVQTADTQVGFGVTPVSYTGKMLGDAIASAGRAGGKTIQLDEIHSAIENFVHKEPNQD